jgi:hypothetical protein
MPDSVFKVGFDGDTVGIQAAGTRAKRVIKDVHSATKETNDSLRSVGTTGGNAFGEVASTVVKATTAMGIGLRMLAQYKEAAEKTFNAAQQKARGFMDQRDRLGELATAMGQRPNTTFTLQNQKFNAETALTFDQGLDYRMQFQNSGAAYKGRTMSDKEFDEYEKQAAMIGKQRGSMKEGAASFGDLTGTLAGIRDRSGEGDQASEGAISDLSSGMAILGRGKGRNSVLVNQASMLMAAGYNQDEFKGMFSKPTDVFALISIAAEKHDAQANEMAQAAFRALHSNDEKVKALKAKAGVKGDTPLIESLTRIGPILEKEAKDEGITLQEKLANTFDSILERDAIGVYLNKGVSGGGFADRAAYGAENADSGKALADAASHQTAIDEGAAPIMAEQQHELQKQAQGSQEALLAQVRTQAKQVRDAQLHNNTPRQFAEMLNFTTTSYDRENLEMAKILQERGKAVGMDAFDLGLTKHRYLGNSPRNDVSEQGLQAVTPEGQEGLLREAMTRIAKKGGNPLGDGQIDPALVALLQSIDTGIKALAKPPEAAPTNTVAAPMRGGQRP